MVAISKGEVMAKSNWIVVEAEVAEVQKALEGTSKSLTSIQKQALGIIARQGVKTIRQKIRQTIEHKSRSTGELQKAYAFRVKKDASEANIFPKGVAGSKIFPKAYVQNYGYSGPTARAKEWNVKPKGFIEQTENFLDTSNFEEELGKMIDKVLSKYWG